MGGLMGGELATSLRAWRGRMTPDQADLSTDRRRRVPGLRRQELATMAGISVEYLVRLEQGRARRPSVEVVESLARALRLTSEELAHLRRLSGHAMTGSGTIDRHLSPAIWRILIPRRARSRWPATSSPAPGAGCGSSSTPPTRSRPTGRRCSS